MFPTTTVAEALIEVGEDEVGEVVEAGGVVVGLVLREVFLEWPLLSSLREEGLLEADLERTCSSTSGDESMRAVGGILGGAKPWTRAYSCQRASSDS